MNIGIEIRPESITFAISEDQHFTILEEVPLTIPFSLVEAAHQITHFLPTMPEDPFFICIPSFWSLGQRQALSAALHADGIFSYVLVPDCIAALATLKNLHSLPEDLDLVLLNTYSGKNVFSFLSCFSTDASPLWEGTFLGDQKFLRKMANALGYLHKGQLSSTFAFAGDADTFHRLSLSPAEQKVPFLPLQREGTLQGITLYQATTRTLLSHLCFRCHSRFYVQKEGASEMDMQLLLSAQNAWFPLPWNDYCCLYFFSQLEKASWETFHQASWKLHEVPFHANIPSLFQEDTSLLFSFELNEPAGLWVSCSDGTVELLPFAENQPQLEKAFFSSSQSQNSWKQLKSSLSREILG